MANFVHKSSNDNKNKKKIIIISSTIVGILAIVGITLGILFGLGVFNKNDEKYTYFSDLAHMKVNTVEVLNKVDDKENVFLFIYNNDELDAKESAEDDEYNKDDEEILKQIVDLANVIEAKNETIGRDLFFLYLVDTSIAGNEVIYDNSSYGSISPDNDPSLQYYHNGNISAEVPEELEKFLDGNKAEDYNITYQGTNKKLLIACIKDSKNFIREIQY